MSYILTDSDSEVFWANISLVSAGHSSLERICISRPLAKCSSVQWWKQYYGQSIDGRI